MVPSGLEMFIPSHRNDVDATVPRRSSNAAATRGGSATKICCRNMDSEDPIWGVQVGFEHVLQGLVNVLIIPN